MNQVRREGKELKKLTCVFCFRFSLSLSLYVQICIYAKLRCSLMVFNRTIFFFSAQQKNNLEYVSYLITMFVAVLRQFRYLHEVGILVNFAAFQLFPFVSSPWRVKAAANENVLSPY